MRHEMINRAPVPADGDGGAAPRERAPRVGLIDQINAVRRSAIVPEAEPNLVKPEYGEEFRGKRVLVTGVSHLDGFGYETSKQLVEMGATVAFTFRERTNEVGQVEADLQARAEKSGGRAVGLNADFAKVDQAVGLVSRAVNLMKEGEEDTGRLDIYVDNAGVIAKGMLHDQASEEVVRDTTINVISPQIVLGEAVAQMRENPRGKGRVVSVLSVGVDGAMDQARYAGAKAHKWAAARSGAMEAKVTRKDTTYVSVAPGLSPTTMTSVVDEKTGAMLMNIVGQKELLSPSQVADYIVFAASSHADEMNGQAIPARVPMLQA